MGEETCGALMVGSGRSDEDGRGGAIIVELLIVVVVVDC